MRWQPISPYKALGVAALIEDAAVLARCLKPSCEYETDAAIRRWESHLKPTTFTIRAIVSAKTWMQGGDADASWLYGYGGWNVGLDQPGSVSNAMTQ